MERMTALTLKTETETTDESVNVTWCNLGCSAVKLYRFVIDVVSSCL